MFFHRKRGLTMPNMARKKMRMGNSKLMPRPRMMERKKPEYSSMVIIGVKFLPKSSIRICSAPGRTQK